MAFCGHATIAILNDIVANNEALQLRTKLSVATRTDRLEVENRYQEEKCVYISAPSPRFSAKEISGRDIATALNSHIGNIEGSLPIQIVNGGLETLVVPMRGLASILSVKPDLQVLKEFCLRHGVDIVILYTSEVAFQENRYRTRVFAPTYGYLEDPATGSGNAAFGYYLVKNAMWNGEMIKIEQNGFREAPNLIQLLFRDSRVWFGGSAIVRIDGQYLLY